MKITYEKPVMDVERFQANEFFAACGETNKVYKFVCDAGDQLPGLIYIDTNNDGVLNDGDTLRSGFTSCGATHDAPTKDDFQNGFYTPLAFGKPVPVIVWTANDTNTHATTKLNMEEWETAKS